MDSAKDPLIPRDGLDAIIEKAYFGKTGGEVMCFGAGGSGVATLLHLINKKDKADRPEKERFVNRSQGRWIMPKRWWGD